MSEKRGLFCATASVCQAVGGGGPPLADDARGWRRGRWRALQRAQELDEVGLLLVAELQRHEIVVVLDDVGQRRGRAVVEVGRVLSERAQRGRAIELGRAALGGQRLLPDLGGGVQRSLGVDVALVTPRAATVALEDELAARGGRRIEAARRRRRLGERELVVEERRQPRPDRGVGGTTAP
jgi:hypothetical protein